MPCIRELDIYTSVLQPGPLNAITDVNGVAVGQFTLIEGEGPRRPGKGPYRTGVTIVLPHDGNLYEEKVPAAVHTINGFGKATGFEQIRELGNIETPIALTGTLNVPRVADALITIAVKENPYIGLGFAETGHKGYATINPVVGETNDGFLSDIQARPIGEAEVRKAISSASSGPVAEGVVGAGTGTTCFGWKGGIGTSSRRLPESEGAFTVGALVQSNFGGPSDLTIAGVPVGLHLQPPNYTPQPKGGSIMMILATDAPLDSRQLGRLCHRAAFGLARTGSACQAGSGDFVVAFSTAYRICDRPGKLLSERLLLANESMVIGALGRAVIETIEEAIYNSLLMAHTVVGRDGHTVFGLPAEEVVNLIRQNRGA